MGMLSGLFWMLAGGSYVAGGLAKDHVLSQGHQHSDIVHDMKWYEEHALELNHDRQEELFKLYKENLPAFEALSGCKECLHYDGLYYMTGMNWGGYFDMAASGIARREGWIYDNDFRLNDKRKQAATPESMNEMLKYKFFVKLQRKEYETAPDALRTPYVGDNGNWWFGGRGGRGEKDTGIFANLESFPWVSDDKVWMFGAIRTQYAAPSRAPFPMISKLTDGAPNFEYGGDGWYIDCPNDTIYTVLADRLKIPPEVNGARLMSDGCLYTAHGDKTGFKLSPGRWQRYEFGWDDNRTITINALLEWEDDLRGSVRPIGWYTLDTGIPVIRFRKLQFNDKVKAELSALIEAAWIWPQDTEELKVYCDRYGCMKEFSDFMRSKDMCKTSIFILIVFTGSVVTTVAKSMMLSLRLR